LFEKKFIVIQDLRKESNSSFDVDCLSESLKHSILGDDIRRKSNSSYDIDCLMKKCNRLSKRENKMNSILTRTAVEKCWLPIGVKGLYLPERDSQHDFQEFLVE
jgi:hypothetical protein